MDNLTGTIRAELARRQVSVRQAARAAGISNSTLARRLTLGDFKIDELHAIATVLGMPLHELIPDESAEAAS